MAIARESSAELRVLARKVFLSQETIEDFLSAATPGQVSAVIAMLENEQSVRLRRRKESLFRKARFPTLKSFEGYDFSQVAFPEGYSPKDLKSLDFVQDAQDFVFHGQTGRGKTHLAIALGVACVGSGMEARFYTAAELVLALGRAKARGDLDAFLRDLAKARMLIIDELGYVPLDIDGARLLFQVMSECYERRSMVITTNIEFSKWGTVFGDDKMAAAIIDRIVHHGRLVEFTGSSHRMDAALMLGKKAE